MEVVRKSQYTSKSQILQVKYLSLQIRNEFIDLYGSFIQAAIINEIHFAKYFSIIIDASPDYFHQENNFYSAILLLLTKSFTNSVNNAIIFQIILIRIIFSAII